MNGPGERDARAVRAGGTRSAVSVPVTALAATLLATGGVTARDARAAPVELWLSDAPLARVLEHVAGNDGIRVIVDDSIDGVVDGRLDGERENVLARLVVEHGLAVHGDGDTVWFDRADRPVVEFVELPPDDAARALSALVEVEADPASVDAVVERSDEGLMLSGPRAFVETARDRLAALPQVIEETATTDGVDLSSVSDIPGYDVDYTKERRL